MSHQLWTSLIKYNVSPNQLYFLDCCRHKIRPANIIDYEAEKAVAENRGHITTTGVLSPGAVVILDEFEKLLAKTKKAVASEVLGVQALEFINKYREIFPAKRIPKIGVLRQSVQELKDKFVWFFKTYPEFTWEDVLMATDHYMHVKINKENMDFMTTSSYFIQRTDTFTKVNRSLLADYCQMIKDDPNVLNEP